MPTKLRAENASVSEYLFSRSVAGTTHQDLIDSMEKLTEGQIKGRFFSFYPERNVSLLHWLAKWIQLGAVPILTINLQKGFDWLPGIYTSYTISRNILIYTEVSSSIL